MSVSAARFAAVPPSDTGTAEPEWAKWLDRQGPWARPRFDVEVLVVLAAHPDDEVLGASGMMSAAIAAGVHVVTVCLSDGAGSHPGSPTMSPPQLAARRHLELDTAAAILGLDPPRWCGLPDGSLEQREDDMAVIVGALLDEHRGSRVGLLSVWAHDGHPDHEAVGRCAQTIGAQRNVPVWMYPVWMWHWACPGDPAIPWDRLRAHPLAEGVLGVKRAAVRAFASQIRPLSPAPEDQAVLSAHMLSHLLRDREFVFE
ncbi:PIG-L deacetylase family protein [Gordonia sp. NPDC003585]|uniref:PIG-L deacetylase family protein n=1 Tax=Gordonia sp. NPDC003585 TaxID=3154275 RepID=UPI0033AA5486